MVSKERDQCLEENSQNLNTEVNFTISERLKQTIIIISAGNN